MIYFEIYWFKYNYNDDLMLCSVVCKIIKMCQLYDEISQNVMNKIDAFKVKWIHYNLF